MSTNETTNHPGMKLHFFTIVAVSLTMPMPIVMAEDEPRPTATPKPVLCRGYYHSEEEAVKQLVRMAATYSNLERVDEYARRSRFVSRSSSALILIRSPIARRSTPSSTKSDRTRRVHRRVRGISRQAPGLPRLRKSLSPHRQESSPSRNPLSAWARARSGRRAATGRISNIVARRLARMGAVVFLLRHDWVRRLGALGLEPRT